MALYRLGPRSGRWVYLIAIVALALVACGRTPEKPAAPQPAEPEPAPAEPAEPEPTVEFMPRSPTVYRVKEGDTLWDIAQMFLKDPWYWPELWYDNPTIANPHRIYPGDRLVLQTVDGRARLSVAERGRPTLKLSPRVREKPLPPDPIPTVALSELEPFIGRPHVVDPKALEAAPYIFGTPEARLLTGANDRVYARRLGEAPADTRYGIYRQGEVLRDPQTGEVLGHAAAYIGRARIVATGDPTLLTLEATEREVRMGDRLLPVALEKLPRQFQPQAPPAGVSGFVIELSNAISQVGQYQVVTLNLGTTDGLEPGHVLATTKSGRQVVDPYGAESETLTLPDRRVGLVLVFRSYDRVSHALVMESSRPIERLDRVVAPEAAEAIREATR